MAWRIVIEGEGDSPPSIRPWIRSVRQDDTVTAAAVVSRAGPDPLEPGEVVTTIDLLVGIEDGD